MSGKVVPVCSRAFLSKHGPVNAATDLTGFPLIHDEDRATWVAWLPQQGVPNVHHALGPLFEDGQLTLNAAQAALGVALLREPLICRELASGELVRLFDTPLDDGRDY